MFTQLAIYRPSHCFGLQRSQREVNINSNSGNQQLELHDAMFTGSRKNEENSYTLPTNSYGRSRVFLHTLAQLLGVLESHRPAVWRAPLHFRQLQAQLIRDLQKSKYKYCTYESKTYLTNTSKTEIKWWLMNLRPIVPLSPDIIIFTDASKMGWGAVSNDVRTNGKWSAQEKMFHINVLELKGALLAIQALLKIHRQITVSVNMDNSTAVSYINHKGGTHSMELVLLTLELWDCCMLRDIYLIAQHVPGKTNTGGQRIEGVPGRD